MAPVGGILILGLLLAAGWLSLRDLGNYNDAYASAFGTIPTRREIADERTRDPLADQRRLFTGRRLTMARLFLPLPDADLDRLRRRAAGRFVAMLALWVLAVPLLQLINAWTGGPGLSANWPILTVFRVAFLGVAVSCWIQWLVARANQAAPIWWRRLCLTASITAAMSFAVVWFMS